MNELDLAGDMRQSIKQCSLVPHGKGSRCTKCGKELNFPPEGVNSWCRAQGNQTVFAARENAAALGDITEAALRSIGITEDRYKAAKELFGMSPTCNCQKRKDWLNKVSNWWAGESS